MIGRMTTNLEAPNNQPWKQDFRFWVGKTRGVPAVIAAASAVLRPRGCGSESIPLTEGADQIVILDNVVSLRLTQDEMGDLTPGSYDLEVNAILDTGDAKQIRGAIDIVAGL